MSYPNDEGGVLPSLPSLPTLALSLDCSRAVDRPRARPRARLSIHEREKVREVRRQGACLRCRMLKIQVCVSPRRSVGRAERR